MTDTSIRLELDRASDLAYIRLSDAQVERTCAVSDAINLDLDQFGVVVGIEVLELGAEIPFQRLVSEFHIAPEKIDMLRSIRPSVQQFAAATMTEPQLDLAESGGVVLKQVRASAPSRP